MVQEKKPIQQEIQYIEGQINNIQLKPLHQQDHALENSLIMRYEQNLTKLNQLYKQRAKKPWAKGGRQKHQIFFIKLF